MYGVPLTYAYSTQGHRITRLPTFSLFLSRQPPGPTIRKASLMLPNVEHTDCTMALRIRNICRAAELKRMSDKTLRQDQERCKGDHDKKVWLESTFASGYYAFAERLPLTITAAERLSTETYSINHTTNIVEHKAQIEPDEIQATTQPPMHL